MNKELEDALNIIKQACASVVANWESHQIVQTAIAKVEEELSKEIKK